jgi:acyl-CoA reductase-like NAD-dependent aldehyde dehydrogenase
VVARRPSATTPRRGGVQAPTGGVKDSGFGRERGLPGMRNDLQVKNVGIGL